jgi:hypothetical protein
MIEAVLSLDDEAQLYCQCLYRSPHSPPYPMIHSVRSSPQVYRSHTICDRCGCSGHSTWKYTERLPSADELEALQACYIDECVREAEEGAIWDRDQFGLFQKNGGNFAPIETVVKENGKDRPLNWGMMRFCLNRGRPGHHFSKCSHTAFTWFVQTANMRAEAQGAGSSENQWSSYTEMWQTKVVKS